MDLIFVGTLHTMLPGAESELRQVLETFNSDHLLLEIDNNDLSEGKIGAYPREMQFAAEWARSAGRPVFGFDFSINVRKNGVTKNQEDEIFQKQLKALIGKSWKDANKRVMDQVGDLALPLIDLKKWTLREETMAKNIEKYRSQSGPTLVLTGASHLTFFEKSFPTASFPFRK